MKKHILSVSIFNTVRNFTVYLHSPCILGESKWIPKRLHAIGDTWTGSEVGIIPHSHRRKEKRKQWEERMREEREKPREREAVKREKNMGRGKLSSLIGVRENMVKSMCLYTSFLPNCSHCPLWQQQCELKTGKVVHCWYFICAKQVPSRNLQLGNNTLKVLLVKNYFCDWILKLSSRRIVLVVQWLGLPLTMQRVWIGSLVREQRSHMPPGQKSKTQNRSNIVTNAKKTLKMVHIKKQYLIII